LARKLGAYDLEFPGGGPCWPRDPAGWVQLGVVAPARVAHTPIGLVNAVELRGFEPLTPCMPSRDPDRSGPTKPRITRHPTEAVVVTRGVSRGLVRMQLLPRCCPPNDHEHAPPPGPRRWRPLPRESESGVFLTMGRIAAAPVWRNRSKSQDRDLHVFMCVHLGRRSKRRLVGPASVLPERLLPATGGHHLSCSFTFPSPEPTSATSDLVTVSALSEKTENRRT
jgi:hypothetical protein